MKGFRKLAVLQAACILVTGGAAAFPVSPVPAMTVTAADYEEETYGDFTIHKYETYVEIAKYNGTDTEITVPDMIDGLPVLSIGDSAFVVSSWFGESITKKITSIKLPKTLLNIGYGVFRGCKSMESIEIPDSVTEMGACLFEDCIALRSVKLPKKLKVINYRTFCNCQSLETVAIPKSVTTIRNDVFRDCAALTSISFPENCGLSPDMFINCTSLKDVIIPEGCKLTTVSGAEYFFSGCKNLETVKLPASFETISSSMFAGCTALKEITIPDNYHTIDNSAFESCSALTNVVIPESVNKVNGSAFKDCARLEKITFLNPTCSIYNVLNTICNYTLNGTSYYNGVICGYEGSTAQTFAETFDLEFESLGEIPTTTTTTVTTTAPVTTTTVTTTTAPVTTKATITTEATKPVTTAPVTTTTKRITTAFTTRPKVTVEPGVTTTVQTTTTKPEPTIKDLEIKIDLTPPTKTEFKLGETVDYTGAYFSYTISLPSGGGMGRSPMNLSSIKEPLYQIAFSAGIGQDPQYVFPLMLIVDRTKVNIKAIGEYPVTVSITDQTGSTVLAQESFNIKISGTAQTVPAVTTAAAVPVTTKVITTTKAPATTKATATTKPAVTTKPAATTKPVATTKPAATTKPVTTAPAVATTPAATSTTPATTTAPAPQPLKGDFNGDGEVSVEDAQLTLKAYTRHVAGLESTLTPEEEKAADVNGDGEVSVDDAQLILRYYTEKYVAGKDELTWEDLLKKK